MGEQAQNRQEKKGWEATVDRVLEAAGELTAAWRREQFARAELAERTCERGHSDATLEAAARDMAQMAMEDRLDEELVGARRECDRLRGERNDLRHQASVLEAMLAGARAELAEVRRSLARQWAADHAELTTKLATARRDAATEALASGAGLAVRWGEHDLAADMRLIAAEIGDGIRPVPGSPEPAPAGGEDSDHG
jgi:hypothetical protein